MPGKILRARFLCAVMILAVAAPAYAQVNILVPNIKYKTQEEVDQAARRDQDYKATIQKLPDQKASNDPWGNIRSSTPAPAEHKTKKKKASAQ